MATKTTGVMDMHDKLRETIDLIIKEYGPVKEVILFGSRARGEADEYSDTDLIVIKDTRESFVRRLANLPVLPIAADVFVYTPSEFETMKANENPFIMRALAHSQVVYSQNNERQ